MISLLTQRTRFCAGDSQLVIDNDPQLVEALEMLAIAIGAKKETNHSFRFSNHKLLEVIFRTNANCKNVPTSPQKMLLCCENQVVVLDGDSPEHRIFYAFLSSVSQNSSSKIFNFQEENKILFGDMINISEAMGLVPCC